MTNLPPSRWHRFTHATNAWMVLLRGGIVALLCTILFGVFYWIDPSQTTLTPPCMFYTATGWYCPGCGGTRWLHALLTGHWYAALHLNAWALIMGPICVAFIWQQILWPFITARPARTYLWAGWFMLLCCVTLVIFGIVRNLPWFGMLRP
ncbi:MAG: DUF2752 domain-containing protein [Phycisphaerae bacterium]